MSVTQIDRGFFGIQLTLTPDNEYEYLHFKDMTNNGHMHVRKKGDLINFWNIEKGEWCPEDFSFKKMKNIDDLIMTTITSDLEITLPSKDQAYAQLNRNNN